MSKRRSERIDRRTAEQILSGAADGRGHAVDELLAAATAPARERELRGEFAAVAAFQAARLEPAPRLGRRLMIRTTLAKVLTTKVAVAAAATAAVTVGGVATVAATGHLPGSSSGHSAQTSVAASASSTTESKSAPSHSATAGNSTDPSGKPSPSLVGLCHAYTAGAGSEHGKALESPAFTVLITTAGGKDKVDAYCAKLLADEAATPTSDAAKDHSNDAHPDSHDNRVTPTRPSH